MVTVLAALLPIWKVIKGILTFQLSVPVFVILLAVGWFYFDRSSAIRTAVNNAVTKLVAGAELAAKDELILVKDKQIIDAKRVIERQQERLESEQKANEDLQNEIAVSTERNKLLKENLNALPTKTCTAGDSSIDERFFNLLPK